MFARCPLWHGFYKLYVRPAILHDYFFSESIATKTLRFLRIRRGVSRGARSNGSARPRPAQNVVTDARLKIIQKNREKLTDARDKLAEIAKQSDARLKLDKLRATHLKKNDAPIGGISRKTSRNGRISLTTNKIPPLVSHIPPQNYMPPPTRSIGYRQPLPEPHYMDEMPMDYNDGKTFFHYWFHQTVNWRL